MSELLFRVRPPRNDNSAMVAAILNALNDPTVVRVIALSTMSDETYNALVENIATEGDTFLRFDNAATAIRAATVTAAKKVNRQVKTTAVDMFDDSANAWNVVGHVFKNRV